MGELEGEPAAPLEQDRTPETPSDGPEPERMLLATTRSRQSRVPNLSSDRQSASSSEAYLPPGRSNAAHAQELTIVVNIDGVWGTQAAPRHLGVRTFAADTIGRTIGRPSLGRTGRRATSPKLKPVVTRWPSAKLYRARAARDAFRRAARPEGRRGAVSSLVGSALAPTHGMYTTLARVTGGLSISIVRCGFSRTSTSIHLHR
jgi:hypothetical protein